MITDTTPHADVEHVWGTVVSVQTVGTPDPEAVAAFFAELHEIDRIFSPYRPDSEVSRRGLVNPPPEE